MSDEDASLTIWGQGIENVGPTGLHPGTLPATSATLLE